MLGEQCLVQRSPVHADTHRLLVLDRNLDHGAEIVVVLASNADVARINSVLGQRPRALGILLQQEVSVVVEVANDGHADALLLELLDDRRDGRCRFFVVDRDPNQFGPGASQGGNLLDCRGNIGGVGIGHRLHHKRCIAAHSHPANQGGNGFSALNISHGEDLF